MKEKIDEISEYRVIDTKNGFVRIHKLHGKKEKKKILELLLILLTNMDTKLI